MKLMNPKQNKINKLIITILNYLRVIRRLVRNRVVSMEVLLKKISKMNFQNNFQNFKHLNKVIMPKNNQSNLKK